MDLIKILTVWVHFADESPNWLATNVGLPQPGHPIQHHAHVLHQCVIIRGIPLGVLRQIHRLTIGPFVSLSRVVQCALGQAD